MQCHYQWALTRVRGTLYQVDEWSDFHDFMYCADDQILNYKSCMCMSRSSAWSRNFLVLDLGNVKEASTVIWLLTSDLRISISNQTTKDGSCSHVCPSSERTHDGVMAPRPHHGTLLSSPGLRHSLVSVQGGYRGGALRLPQS